MINGLEGIPGSGKSYEATVYHVLDALKRGRKVITNLPLNLAMFTAIDPAYADLIEVRSRPAPVRGTWDAYRMDDKGNGNAFELWPQGRTERAADDVQAFGHVWDYWTDWRHPETGQGPLFVIDECHVALPKIGTAKAVIEWYKLHRHFNVDVLLMTQSFRDVCASISGLLSILIRCRKADILGRKDSYIRKVFSGYRGAPVSQEERKYMPQYFALYKSHTQGSGIAESGASDVSPFIVKFRRFMLGWWVLAAVAVVWAFWPQDKPKPAARPPAKTATQAVQHQPLARPASAASDARPMAAAPAVPVSSPAADDGEPLSGKLVHITGRIAMADRVVYTFAVSEGGRRIFDATSDELRASGYAFEPLADCAGFLRYAGKARPVVCNAPHMTAGHDSKPIVVAVPAGRSPS
jgi:zona occludens toxin